MTPIIISRRGVGCNDAHHHLEARARCNEAHHKECTIRTWPRVPIACIAIGSAADTLVRCPDVGVRAFALWRSGVAGAPCSRATESVRPPTALRVWSVVPAALRGARPIECIRSEGAVMACAGRALLHSACVWASAGLAAQPPPSELRKHTQ
eukprot:CAMPEP_0115836768 /NCGR_PEP_ID=MMETSP0287-20121206/4879_1 /TAXON_ID=412157 /ORGANISM="Chrysochromulina rotalis, Strain UIO044" /LENGTH=151 /DNA_ID=CAMNT_0003290265 /DNA_START=46 /DNA_END=498 /DNA_ORIENTATION=+